MFVNIALNIPADKLFTYEVPENLTAAIAVGKRVYVSFGRRKRTGYIVEIISGCDLVSVKPITEILDDESLFSPSDLKFYQWTANYFMRPLGQVLAEILPTGAEKKDYLQIVPLAQKIPADLAPQAKQLMAVIEKYPQGVKLSVLQKNSFIKNIAGKIEILRSAGLVRLEEKQNNQLAIKQEKYVFLREKQTPGVKLTVKQESILAILFKTRLMEISKLKELAGCSDDVIKRMQEKGIIEIGLSEKIRTARLDSLLDTAINNISLNDEQNTALEKIKKLIHTHSFSPVLLHGVTGSGKTEVYLNAIAEALKNKGSAIYLVPEIALTPQLISRVQGRFNNEQIAVLHSGIAESSRYDQWRQIKRGRIRVVIGARSAVFAPLPDLRLLVVDEEHDASYKQDDRLCYNARDLAVLRAKLTAATVILGSATPAVVSYFNAQAKKYSYLELTKRVAGKPLPQIEIVDMKTGQESTGKVPIISDNLIAALELTLSRKEQALLFLNRRGFDTFLTCADCGYQFKCPNCAVSLKHHAAEALIKCHYCDYAIPSLPLCPSCKSSRILSYGAGTQKLEKQTVSLFPEARVARMDSDTVAKKGAHEKILQALARRQIDILIGTQMITKGHDFPFITLVGVISADTVLNMPDFRAAEKTFQQLTQVAGRGGRGDTPGRVIIQTFNPQHYVLKHVQNHDYKSFYQEEISFRQALQYPPLGRIINLRLSAANKEALLLQADKLGKLAKRLAAKQKDALEIIGPAESPLAKIQGRWRFQMLLKGKNAGLLHQVARELILDSEKKVVKVIADVDPENFM